MRALGIILLVIVCFGIWEFFVKKLGILFGSYVGISMIIGIPVIIGMAYGWFKDLFK